MHSEHHLRDEFYNAVTHGLGAFLSVVGGLVLVVLGALYGDVWQLASAIVFGLSLIGLYGASTLYHSTHEPKAKLRYKILDHCMIYVLIAGSYTPFAPDRLARRRRLVDIRHRLEHRPGRHHLQAVLHGALRAAVHPDVPCHGLDGPVHHRPDAA